MRYIKRMHSQPLRLLLVAHHPGVRAALTADLAALGQIVIAVGDTETAGAIAETGFDAAIVEDAAGIDVLGYCHGIPTVARLADPIGDERQVLPSASAAELVSACRRAIAESEADVEETRCRLAQQKRLLSDVRSRDVCARLIAAAPDLLEACEAAAAFFGPHPVADLHPPQTAREHEAMAALVSLVKQLAAAIQKARGV